MEFKEFFSLMKNRISDGADVPYFFRDLIVMITDVPEEKWDTPKDPSSRLTKESTLRSYAKRGLTKKFAQSIVYNLSPEMFEESLKTRPRKTIELLADDYRAYDPTATADNVKKKLADCFIDIIQITAGVVPKDELERQSVMRLSNELKVRYGTYLREEAGNTCAFPGCGSLLAQADSGKVMPVYEVAVIDKSKEPRLDNLLAFCPKHHAIYSLDDNKKISRELAGIKKILIVGNISREFLERHSAIKSEIDALKIQNAAFRKQNELQEAKSTAEAVLRRSIEDILFEIEETLNAKMKEFNDTLFTTKKKPPHIHFNAYNSYKFEPPDNTGTGSNYKGMLIYDLAMLFTTNLPALAHDSLLFTNLGKDAVDGIMQIYNICDKQIFISYDKQDDCRPATKKILEDNCVLRLSTDNCELYGRSWDTEE